MPETPQPETPQPEAPRRGTANTESASSAPLKLRVLSLARGVGAAFAVRQLADLGAECSWWLWSEPLSGDWPPDKVFRSYFEAGIELVESHSSTETMLTDLIALAGSFDVIVTDLEAGEAAEGELYRRLAPYNPAIVIACLSHFGRTGPYAHWVGDELTDYAMGGYWGIAGHPEREPLRVPGYQAQFHGGMNLSLAVVAAARSARRLGIGQEVECSALEAMLGSHWDATVAWTHTGGIINRTGPDLFKTRDGYVFFYQVVFFPNLVALIDRPELGSDPRWTTWPEWLKNASQFWEIVAEWCRDRLTDDIVEAAQKLRLPVVAMANAQTLLDDTTLKQRDFFRLIDGKQLPGRPVRSSVGWSDPETPKRLSLLMSEPPEPVRVAPFGASSPARTTAGGPLSGIRVLELTNNWAGPLAGRHLGDLGAEVIKVELATKPATRAGFHPGGVPGRRHWNRAGYFHEMNRNKRGVCLNLASEAGRELFLSLVADVDVVLENNSSRVMPKLGIGYSTLQEINPRLVMASISGFGATGDRRDWVAFGSNIEAATGIAAITGYDASVPYRTSSFVADPIGGTQAALAIVAALERVDRDGVGTHLDLSLIEATLPFVLAGFAHLHSTGEMLVPTGNSDSWDAPTGAYPTDGPDEWIAIAVRDDTQWVALAEVAGLDVELGRTREARIAHRQDIDDGLRSWTVEVAQYEAVRQLQAVGVPAAPILKNPQFHTDPHLFARNAFIPIEHPDTGVLPYPGFPWRFSATPPSVRYAAPRFAEGNDYVFGQLAGLDREGIEQLYRDGASSLEPIGIAPM